jgi:pimeloyl-ACP methyl ester carboxylesterase
MIKVYATASAIPGETPVVLYLPSTKLEEPCVNDFLGGEMVYVPQVKNSGTPWKNDFPNWLPGWVARMQHCRPRVVWSVFGFSRGAAWAAEIATEPGLKFHSVVLVAPYVLPRHSAPLGSPKTQVQTRLETMLPEYKHQLLIVFGENDEHGTWERPLYNYASTQLMRHIRPHCCDVVIPRANHDGSLRLAAKEYWPPLSCMRHFQCRDVGKPCH